MVTRAVQVRDGLDGNGCRLRETGMLSPEYRAPDSLPAAVSPLGRLEE
jgi:hypothetical protein